MTNRPDVESEKGPLIDRRRALFGLAGAAATCACCGAFAQSRPAKAPYRIDTHQHILPPPWLAEERERVLYASQGAPTELIDGWTPQKLDEQLKGAFGASFTPLERSTDVFSWDPV